MRPSLEKRYANVPFTCGAITITSRSLFDQVNKILTEMEQKDAIARQELQRVEEERLRRLKMKQIK